MADNMTTLQILQGIHDWVLDKIDEETANFITKTVNDLVNYYTKSETYTKAEVQQIVDAIKQFTYEVVQVLPTASASTMNKIYLVPAPKSEDKNVNEEYITIQNGSTYSWEMLGTTSIDLSNYYTKGQTDSAISSALSSALDSYTTTADLTTLLAQKQDVIQDLAAIRSGASAGATAVQPSTLNSALSDTVAESGVYDVTANNNNAKFASLSALLGSENLDTLIPSAKRKGGMSVKFVLSSDNNYIQYRLKPDDFSTDVEDWEQAASATQLEELEDNVVMTGSYDATVAVGLADNLRGDAIVSAEFYKRKTGGTQSVGSGIAAIKEIRGKSIVWNQLLSKQTTTTTDVGITYVGNGDGSITVNGTATKQSSRILYYNSIVNHKYLYKGCPSSGRGCSLRSTYVTAPQDVGYGAIWKATGTNFWLSIVINNGITVNDLVFKPQLFDLTLMFGAGNEPATVAEFVKMFPLDYYDYNAREVIPFAGQNLTTTGKNQYNSATGKANLLGGQIYQISGTYTKVYPTVSLIDYTYGSPVVSDTYYTNANSHYVGAKAVSAYDNTKTYALGSYCINDNTIYKSNVAIETAEEFDVTHWYIIADVAAMVTEGIFTLWDIVPDANGLFTLTKDTEVTIVDGNDTDTMIAIYNGENVSFEPYEKHTLPLDPSQWRDKQGNLVFPYGGMHGVDTSYDYAKVDADGYIRRIIRVYERRAYESGDTELTNVITDGITYTFYPLATPVEVELATPIYAKYLVDKDGTEEITPANGAAPYTTMANLSILYAMDARGEIKNLPKNYLSKESAENMLNAMVSAGVIASYTMTYDAANARYQFTIVKA